MTFLFACQQVRPTSVSIIDDDQVRNLVVTSPGDLTSALARADVKLAPWDRLLVNGYVTNPAATIAPGAVITVQVRHALPLTINGVPLQTAALTVGEALAERGVDLFAADVVDPAANTTVSAGLTVTYAASSPIRVTVDGHEFNVRSAAATTGAALASSGLPLVGLDYSSPAEDQPVPGDGAIRVARVSEALVLAQKTIPYKSSTQVSADIELGTEQVIQAGLGGLSMARTIVRFEDGKEVARRAEPEAVVRPPQDRVVARGSKIAIKTTTVNGATFQYWRAMQMYATVYSPCNSGTGGSCSFGTASGLRAGKGVVAVDPSLYAYLNGQRLYIPAYGFAVIGDLGGGYLVERKLGISRYKWIDLGFDDNNIEDMTGWLTVYFLAPAPASIPDALR
jgi:uncharacterized protein YabE (DUF348 family)